MTKVDPSRFRLERWSSKVSGDCFQCPKCGQWYSAEGWWGEGYGSPEDGTYEITCDCGEVFLLDVETAISYLVSRKIDGAMNGKQLIDKLKKGGN